MAFRDLTNLFSRAPRNRLFGLAGLILLTSLSDGIGLMLLVPLLEILSAGGVGQQQGGAVGRWVLRSFEIAGLPFSLLPILSVFVAVILTRSVLVFARDVQSLRLQNAFVDRLREDCFDALLRADWKWTTARTQSDHANLLVTDINRIGSGLHYGLLTVTGGGTLIAYIASAFILSWEVTLTALIGGALVLWSLGSRRKGILALGVRLGESTRALHAVVQQSLAGLKLTKISGSEDRFRSRMNVVLMNLRRQQESFAIESAQARLIYQAGVAFLLAAFVYVGVEVLAVPITTFLVLTLVFSRLLPQFSGFQQNYHMWLHSWPAWEEAQRLLVECREAAEPESEKEPLASDLVDGIHLAGITLRYDNREEPALHEVSAHFPAGAITAIVGESGSGKTTLADVLCGMLQPDSGTMTVDGQQIERGNCIQWRRSVAYVPQEVFLFSDTVRENLLFAAPAASDDDLVLALRRAAADFVFDLPGSLDCHVGDAGVRLSGGERQRIALARALLRRPALLILDEATSALDARNETNIREALQTLRGHLTVVLISHRMSTVEHADQVVVLDQGHVRFSGDWRSVGPLLNHATS